MNSANQRAASEREIYMLSKDQEDLEAEKIAIVIEKVNKLPTPRINVPSSDI